MNSLHLFSRIQRTESRWTQHNKIWISRFCLKLTESFQFSFTWNNFQGKFTLMSICWNLRLLDIWPSMVRSQFGRSIKTYYLHIGGDQIVEVTASRKWVVCALTLQWSWLIRNTEMVDALFWTNQQELKFLSKGHKWSVPAPIFTVCPAVKLQMFSSHWFSKISSCIYFCGFNWPLSFTPSLILQFPRYHHSSIHLNRIQSPWSRKHHISPKRRDKLMNIYGVITRRLPSEQHPPQQGEHLHYQLVSARLWMRIPVLRLRRAWIF